MDDVFRKVHGRRVRMALRAGRFIHAPGLPSGDELVGGLAQQRERAPRALALILVIEYG
jgi:hypothetical protein